MLLWGRDFPDRPFAPWLVGSDQCEHFFSELRSFRLNQPDWTFADALQLCKRFIHQMEMLSHAAQSIPDVCVFGRRDHTYR